MAEEVVLNEDKHRFEIRVDGQLAGFTRFHISNGVAIFDHTEVKGDYTGRGLAGHVVREALDNIRARGRIRVRPVCPYVQRFIRRHPDYADLVVT